MIRFIDNQFLGETDEGLHRSRIFEIHDNGYQNVGIITALSSQGLLRVITTAPASEHSYKNSAEVIDDMVNRVERAASIIARLFDLSSEEYEFGQSS